METKAIKHLKQLKLQQLRLKHPNVPEHALPRPNYTDKTANGLTKCVIDFLNLQGHHANRINTQGRIIANRITTASGQSQTRYSFAPGTTQRGTSDIMAVVHGKAWAIEIKIGKDKQSEHQRNYQEQIEAAGGIYLLVKTFEDFWNYYHLITQTT